eukprot:1767-Heterococcus_DN1.PRE.1
MVILIISPHWARTGYSTVSTSYLYTRQQHSTHMSIHKWINKHKVLKHRSSTKSWSKLFVAVYTKQTCMHAQKCISSILQYKVACGNVACIYTQQYRVAVAAAAAAAAVAAVCQSVVIEAAAAAAVRQPVVEAVVAAIAAVAVAVAAAAAAAAAAGAAAAAAAAVVVRHGCTL